MIGLGLRIPEVAVRGGGGDPLAPGAPVLTWDTVSSDTTPNFSVDLPSGNGAPLDAAVDDVLHVQVSATGAGAWTDYITNTLDAGEIAGDPITQSGVTPLATGTYDFRARIERGAHIGAWSAIVSATVAISVPVNSVAPVISGNVQVGQTLSTTDGTWSNAPTGYTYQWKRAGSNIASATASTYVLVELDAGAAITCAVVASNAAGAGSAATSNSLTIDVYVVFTAHVEDGADVTTYSGGVWNGVAIGVAAANRKVALALVTRNNAATPVFSSGTIGGQSASSKIGASVDAGLNRAEIVIADVTTGTTANLSTTWSTAAQRCGAGVFAIYGAGSSTPTATASQLLDATNTSLVVPAKGVAIACAFSTGGASCTWTGLTEGYDATVEAGVQHSGASLNSNAGVSLTTAQFDWLNVPSTTPVGVFAAWGP